MRIVGQKIHSKVDELPLDVLLYVCDNAKGIVQICHGMSEYKERYIPLMTFLGENGYSCVIHDHRGHGKSVQSAEDLGYISNRGYAALIEDVRAVNAYIHEQFPQQPVFLFGHSMGSLIVRAYVKRYDSSIDKLIVCGSPSENPLTVVGMAISKVILCFRGDHYRSKLLNQLAFGSYNKGIVEPKSKNSWICANDEVVEEYDKNPLCGFVFTTNGFYSLFDLMRNVYNKSGWILSKPQLPIHFIAGEDDPCITSQKAFQNAIERMKTVGYQQVDGKLYPDMRHEILNEKEKEKVFEDVLSFIEQREIS